MKNIAVIGAGIIGICSAYFLQKSGFKVTLVDHNKPGSMTSYGHACTFADYACIPVNSPTIFKDLPSLLLNQNGPLSVDFKYILKNLPWALSFLKNCRKNTEQAVFTFWRQISVKTGNLSASYRGMSSMYTVNTALALLTIG